MNRWPGPSWATSPSDDNFTMRIRRSLPDSTRDLRSELPGGRNDHSGRNAHHALMFPIAHSQHAGGAIDVDANDSRPPRPRRGFAPVRRPEYRHHGNTEGRADVHRPGIVRDEERTEGQEGHQLTYRRPAGQGHRLPSHGGPRLGPPG